MQISDFNLEWLIEKNKQQKLITNEYLQDSTNENYKYIQDKFFRTEPEKTALLNVGSSLFLSVSDTISFYVDKPEGDIRYNPKKSVDNFFTNGYMILGLEELNGKLYIKNMPTEDHYYDDELKANIILRKYIKTDQDNLDDTTYLLQTIYRDNSIENLLWKLQDDSDYNSGYEVPLDTLPETTDLEPMQITKENPLWIIKEDEREQFPLPGVEKIKSTVYSVDRKAVMFETQFLKNTESFVLFRGMKPTNLKTAKTYSEGGKIEYNQVKSDIHFTDDPAAGIEFVNNLNELIKDAILYEATQIRRISSMTSVPTDYLGLDNAHGAIGEGSRTVLHGAFMRKIQYIRSLMDTKLTEIYEIVAKYNGMESDYSRPDVFVKDDKSLVEELTIAREQNLISLKKAIMEYQDIDMDSAEKEIEEISKEKILFSTIIDEGETLGNNSGKESEDQENNEEI